MTTPVLGAPSREVPAAAAGERRPDIQGLRAIAVLSVIAFHAGLRLRGGFVGVDVFFVISGFVITSMLQREWVRTGRLHLGRFYLRRFRRLTPALALMVAVAVAVSSWALSPLGPQQTAGKTAIGAMLLVANVVIAQTSGDYFGDSAQVFNPLLNTWSLSVEEQFYLVFPALLALGWWLARRSARQAAYLLVGGITLLSFTLAMIGPVRLEFPGSEFLLGFYSPLTRAWEFGAGALLALALARRAAPGNRVLATSAGVVGLGGLGLAFLLINGSTRVPGPWLLLPTAATVLLILAGSLHPAGLLSRGLSWSPLTRVGDWSYSLYLWHWPCIVFMGLLWPFTPHAALIGAAISVVPALVSYRWVEQPLRGFRGATRARTVAFVTTTLAIPLVVAGLLLAVVAQGYWLAPVRAYQAGSLTRHLGETSGCMTLVPISERSAAKCTWNASAPGAPIYLVGDSNADHFGEAVVAAGEQLGRPVTIATAPWCTFTDVYSGGWKFPDGFPQQCRRFLEGTLNWLEDQPPGVVVLANDDANLTTEGISWGRSPDALLDGDRGKAKVMRGGLLSVVTALQAAGHRVLLVQTVPHFILDHAYQPERCRIPDLTSGRCDRSMPLAYSQEQQGLGRWVVESVAEAAGVPVLDLRDVLCPEGRCDIRSADVVRWRDDRHLSPAGNEALVPEFRSAISNAG